MTNQNTRQLEKEIHSADYWAKLIDFTYLSNDYDIPGVLEFFNTSIKYNARAVCSWIDVFGLENTDSNVAKKIAALRGRGILLASVVNFPDGNGGIDLIKKEARMAEDLQLDEVDMALNTKAFNDGDYDTVQEEIKAVTDLFPKKTKLILETGAIKESDFAKAVELANSVKVRFVKTSTGFNSNIDFEKKNEHVKILAEIIKKNNYDLKIKISGGIRTFEQVKIAKDSGADVFGISYGSAVDILNSL